MLDWLIIGGGIHGTYLSHHLTKAKGVPRNKLRVLDPYEDPLAVWTSRTSRLGMQWMRSPRVHHLDLDVHSLIEYMQTRPPRSEKRRGSRLPYSTFQDHSVKVIQQNNLHKLRLHGAAAGLAYMGDGWRVETNAGHIDTRRVVLATGRSKLNWPEWDTPLQSPFGNIWHIFDPCFDLSQLEDARDVLVVGGGTTAGQIALRLAQDESKQVTLLTRVPIRRSRYDSSPCWMGPKCRKPFHQTEDYERRRRMIRAGRKSGTMPDQLAQMIFVKSQHESLRHIIGDIESVRFYQDGSSTFKLASGDMLRSDAIVLATGFASQLPGPNFLPELIGTMNLPVASCGFPIPNKKLEWGPGLFVTGALAELEVGAVAPNILGARIAADRIGLEVA